jgi:hypothetical protein
VHEIDSEIAETAGVTQPLPHTLGTWHIERRRIARAFAFRHGGDADLGHVSLSNPIRGEETAPNRASRYPGNGGIHNFG